jgi:hypothetical protein
MSANYQYSRLLLKRSTETGATPTINTGSTDHTDNTWTPYDIYPGEMYLNIADDRLWVGTLNGVKEIAVTGGTGTIITGTTLGGQTPIFAQANGSTLEFYSLSAGTNVTLSGPNSNVITINSSGGGGGGGNVIPGLNTYTGGSPTAQSVNISAATLATLSVSGNTSLGPVSATSVTILNSGATAIQMGDLSGNIIRTGVTNSTIGAGSGNTINAGLRNVFVAGSNLTATTSDSAYFNRIYSGSTDLSSLLGGTPPTAGNYIGVTGSSVVSLTGVPCDLSFAFSDETTQITTGTNKVAIYAPYAFTITDVQVSLSQSGSALSTFNVRRNGTTIFSTRPTIDANEFHTATALTPRVITGTTVSAADRITVDVDGIGTGCAGGKVYILGNRSL